MEHAIQHIEKRVCQQLINLLQEQGIKEGNLWLLGESLAVPQLFSKENYTVKTVGWNGENLSFGEKKDEKGRAVIVFGFEYQAKPQELLAALHGFCSAQGLPLYICAANIAYKDTAMALMGGEVKPVVYCENKTELPLCPYTSKKLDALLEEKGFLLQAKADYMLESSTQFVSHENTLVNTKSLAHQYLSWLKEVVDPSSSSAVFVRAYAPLSFNADVPQTPEDEAKQEAPFLTVVTRTQGKRIGELREVLLCLTAQSNMDFEMLIIGHKVPVDDRRRVEQLIEELPPAMAGKVQYVALDIGNRSTPLNLGFSLAKGKYISILDDDDLVTDGWVEGFNTLYKKAPGTILHAYSVGQEWERVETQEEGLCAIAKPEATFCLPFNMLRQLHINRCPTMSLAFPAWLFRNSSLRFDETLDTTEDWDFIMRTANITGMSDLDEVTSIYRLWKNASNSYSLYQEQKWARNAECVKDKFNSMPIVFPAGSAKELESVYLAAHALPQHQQADTPETAKIHAVLYGDDGAGYNEGLAFREENAVCLPDFRYTYYNKEKRALKGRLRFDPAEQTGIAVCDFHAELIDSAGNRVEVAHKDCSSNGYKLKNQLIFLKFDPQIYIPVPEGFIPEKIVVSGNISTQLSDATIDGVVGIPLIKRIYRKMRRIIGR